MNKLLHYITYRNVLLFFSLIAAWPCVFYLMGYLPNYKINVVVLLFMGVLFFQSHNKYCYLPGSVKKVLLLQLGTTFIWLFLHFDTSYITRIVFILAAVMTVMADSYKEKPILVKIFVYWITLQCVLSVLGFLLCLTGGFQPLSTFEEMDGRTGYNFGIFTTNTFFGIFVRPAGFFDEPGALACWGMYAMILNQLIVKKKWIEYTLMGTLFVTLSLAYFIQLVMFLFFFYGRHFKKLIIPLFLIAIVAGWIISQDEVFYEHTVGRFGYDKRSGEFVGDNRAELRKNAKSVFLTSPIIGVGASTMVNVYGKKYGDMSGNIYTFLATDGILGLLVMWAPYLYLFFVYGRKNKSVRCGTLILFAGLMQRPFDYNQLLFPLIMYATISTLLIEEYKRIPFQSEQV